MNPAEPLPGLPWEACFLAFRLPALSPPKTFSGYPPATPSTDLTFGVGKGEWHHLPAAPTVPGSRQVRGGCAFQALETNVDAAEHHLHVLSYSTLNAGHVDLKDARARMRKGRVAVRPPAHTGICGADRRRYSPCIGTACRVGPPSTPQAGERQVVGASCAAHQEGLADDGAWWASTLGAPLSARTQKASRCAAQHTNLAARFPSRLASRLDAHLRLRRRSFRAPLSCKPGKEVQGGQEGMPILHTQQRRAHRNRRQPLTFGE